MTTTTKAGQLMGAVKGGHTTQARGACSTRFTSKTGRAAALKKNAHRGASGLILGQKQAGPRTPRAPLRARYTQPTLAHVADRPVIVWYDPQTHTWYEQSEIGDTVRVLSERTALQRLGHLPRRHRRHEGVPISTQPLASPRRKS